MINNPITKEIAKEIAEKNFDKYANMEKFKFFAGSFEFPEKPEITTRPFKNWLYVVTFRHVRKSKERLAEAIFEDAKESVILLNYWFKEIQRIISIQNNKDKNATKTAERKNSTNI